MRSVFSDWSHIKMNATKSMLGHCLGAAAGVEAIATISAILRGEVHPTINHEARSAQNFLSCAPATRERANVCGPARPSLRTLQLSSLAR